MNTITFIVTHWWLWLLISIGLYGFGLYLTVIGANNIDKDGRPLDRKAYLVIPGFISIIGGYLLFVLSIVSLITALIKYVVKG
jgi:hypothetical protein